MDLDTSSFYVCVYESMQLHVHFKKLYYVDILAKIQHNLTLKALIL